MRKLRHSPAQSLLPDIPQGTNRSPPAPTGLMNDQVRSPGIVQCCFVVLVIRSSLVFLGFRKTLRILGFLSPPLTGEEAANRPLALDISRRVAMAAAFLPIRAICIEQSLALLLLLRRRRVAATLKLGVRPYPFLAHAWLECCGEPINEPPELIRSVVSLDVPWE